MALKAYEDACLRAELFGQPKPDKDEFLETHKHLDVVEAPFEEIEIRTAEDTAMLDGDLNATKGGLTELNTILSSTQLKINRLKGVCGSLTNFFRAKLNARDNISYSSEPSYVGQTNYDKDYIPPQSTSDTDPINHGLTTGNQDGGNDINTALSDLKDMQEIDNAGLLSKSKDMKQQVSSQVSKLDNLLLKADKAQSSMDHQNKQMRKYSTK